ncbi:Palmitoyl-acyl carrier protein thioesterase, chloroplastic-like protein [Drosera capensis]
MASTLISGSINILSSTTYKSCDITRLQLLHGGNLSSQAAYFNSDQYRRMGWWSRWKSVSLRARCGRDRINGVASTMELIHGSRVNGRGSIADRVGETPMKRAQQVDANVDHDYDNDDDDHHMGDLSSGKLIDSGLTFRQNFIIRYYEIGPDKTVTVETLMSLLQEAGTNHARTIGLIHEDELVANKMMKQMDLVWVVCRVHVQFSGFCSWRNVAEIDSWWNIGGKNSMLREGMIRDRATKQVIAKVTSKWMMVNNETKRLSKLPEQIKEQMEPFWNHKLCAFKEGEDDTEKIDKLTNETSDLVHSGIKPKWNDLDANQHVNYIKYVGLILESVPTGVLANYDIKSITLEYRKECRHGDVLESLSSMKQSTSDSPDLASAANTESIHLLRKQDDKAEILRARISWRPKKRVADHVAT